QVQEMGGRNPHLLGHTAAIFRDMRGIIVRAQSAVEAGIDAAGDAALAGEEGVAEPGNGQEERGSKHQESPAGCLLSLRPGSEARFRPERPSTLNSVPMPPRPPPVKRFNAPEMSSETSGDAFAINVTARVSMPSRFRKSP